MSKVVLFVALPLVAGLAAWNLKLTSELSELRRDVAAAAREPDARPAPDRSRDATRALQQVGDLAARVARVEAEIEELDEPLPEAPGAAASGTASPPASSADVAPDVASAFASEGFKKAVDRVLEEREQARRRERMERSAELRTRWLLRELTVADAQRDQVRRLVLASMERIDAARNDETLSDDQRREEVQRLQQEQVESLAHVLDAASMETVRKRASEGPRLRQGGPARRAAGPGAGGRQDR